jgi:hypothetical protein
MTTYDQAMAELTAARYALFEASQRRMAVVSRRVRVDSPEAFEKLNQDIADARATVLTAQAAVLAAMEAP